jgi:hypothetical protein
MSGNTVLHTKTALSEQVKFSALTQEVVRRLLHTSRRLPEGVMVECLEKLSQKMDNSDHRTVYIWKVMITGIEKYVEADEEPTAGWRPCLQTTPPGDQL